ncbi:hypothetical protein HRW18_13270 [Streptomyces lunaelactis]|uniref:hypothetical protein n=1 Tax=Streptomyces lunaelactis TaxID=1535768 RepID=UPI001584E8E9|nr:hypothetical protein [Streptomyces lunaelactis]NUK08959.1 hypothetical protein [Streptomyces lunaelactis]NUL10260.1 hypothetical protein [Streptomyces lunaelactis]NUL22779.1 hypothetical protein [Streptomyces lunaelactis]
MSLPAIAILVSCASAVFTASNMLVSYLTYRRANPRVAVRVSYGFFTRDRTEARTEGQPRNGFHVHLISKTQATVRTHQLEAQYRISHRRTYIPHRRNAVYEHPLSFLKGEKETEVAPFGGARWVLGRPFSLIPLSANDVVDRVRILVTLDNGAEITSNWLKMSYVTAYDGLLSTPPPDWYLAEFGPDGPKQLSFDDLKTGD